MRRSCPLPSLLPKLPVSPGSLTVCRATGCRHRSGAACHPGVQPAPQGHTLPGWPLARSRNRNGCGEFAATAAAAHLYSQSCPGRERGVGMPERGQRWHCRSQGNNSAEGAPIPATASWNDAQPTALLHPPRFVSPWTRG